MNLIPPSIEAYAARHSSPESPLFKSLTQTTNRKTSLPQMSVGHLEGQFLKMMVKATRPRRILEIGTFTGYSTLAMAEGLPRNGTLTTLDIDPLNTQIARAYWKKHPAGKKIKLILGPALASLKKLKGPFDLVFIDADKTNYENYWAAVLPKVRPGGLILVDNVLWSGEILNPRDRDSRALAAFNKKILKDRRVECVMLTVRDGVTVAVKK
jgi:caffeoyl-CoA O-methyltransferase